MDVMYQTKVVSHQPSHASAPWNAMTRILKTRRNASHSNRKAAAAHGDTTTYCDVGPAMSVAPAGSKAYYRRSRNPGLPPASMVEKKSAWLFWKTSIFNRVLLKMIVLLIWAGIVRYITYGIELQNTNLDMGVTQLISSLVFVLSIIMSQLIAMAMTLFQDPIKLFRSEVLWPVSSFASKLSAVTVASLGGCMALSGQIKEAATDADKLAVFESARDNAINILAEITEYCQVLPYALYAHFSPKSTQFVMYLFENRPEKPMLHQYTTPPGREQCVLHPNSAEGEALVRTYSTELFELRVWTLHLESVLRTVNSQVNIATAVLNDLDHIRTGVGHIRAVMDGRLPEPYTNMVFLFVYAYLIILPFFFAIFDWWMDVIMYALVIYVMLGTYTLADNLSKEKCFDNSHTYVPFLDWCNETISISTQALENAQKTIRRH